MMPGLQVDPLKIEEEVRCWTHNRRLYPGWIITPRENRNELWENTKEWIQPLLENVDSRSLQVGLIWLRELNWRYEACLMPLFPEFAVAIERVTDGLHLFPELASTNPLPPIDPGYTLNELRDAWVSVVLGLCRFYRETLNESKFRALRVRLAPLAKASPLVNSYLAYQTCLAGLERLDDAEVLSALENWREPFPDPFWRLRRAAMEAEVGNLEYAELEADRSLQEIRALNANGGSVDDIAALSREGWAMMLVRAIKSSRNFFGGNEVPDFRDRWDQLAILRCNPWLEVEWFNVLLESPAKLTAAVSVDKRGGLTLSSSEGTLERLRPALQLIRLIEEAAYPPEIPHVRMSSNLLKQAISWVSNDFPARALALLLRLREDDSLRDFLSLYRVATLKEDETIALYDRAIAAFRKAGSSILSMQPRSPRYAWDEALGRMLTSVRLLTALAVRLSDARLSEILKVALDFRKRERAISDPQLWRQMTELVRTALANSSPEESSEDILGIISQPILDFDFPNQFAHWLDDPVLILMRDHQKANRPNISADWDAAVQRLLSVLDKGSRIARFQATLRCGFLYRIGALHPSEIEAFTKLCISLFQDAVDRSIFENMPPWILLLTPNFGSYDATQVFKTQILGNFSLSVRQVTALPDGTKRVGWPLGPSREDDPLMSVLISTPRPWERTSGRIIPGVDWSEEELEQLLARIEAWWEEEGTQLAAVIRRNQMFGHFLSSESRFHRIFEFCCYTVFLRSHSAEGLIERISTLIAKMADAEIEVSVGLSIHIAAKRNSSEEVAFEFRRSLSSSAEGKVNAAIEGIYVWFCASQLGLIPSVPRDLIDEIGRIVRARRPPALPMAMMYAERILRSSSADDLGITESIGIALQYLAAETNYSAPNPPQPLTVEDIPNLRGLATRLAKRLGELQGFANSAVDLWIKESATEPLNQVRFEMTAVR